MNNIFLFTLFCSIFFSCYCTHSKYTNTRLDWEREIFRQFTPSALIIEMIRADAFCISLLTQIKCISFLLYARNGSASFVIQWIAVPTPFECRYNVHLKRVWSSLLGWFTIRLSNVWMKFIHSFCLIFWSKVLNFKAKTHAHTMGMRMLIDEWYSTAFHEWRNNP